jgi:hypothetical protein
LWPPESLGGGGLGSPAWSQLEVEEGATTALVDVETETEPFAECEGVWTRGYEHLDQEGDSSAPETAPEGSQERAMVMASRPSGSVGESVVEMVWPNPGKPGEARFVLRDHQEEKLWGLLERSGESACGELAIVESGLMEALRKVTVARQTVSGELLSLAQVSLNSHLPSLHFVFSF